MKQFNFSILFFYLISTIGFAVTNGIYDNEVGSPIVNLIESAESSLDIEIYEMDDPSVIEAIRKALDRGVRVHIVKEPLPVGSSCRVFENRNKRAASATVAAASCDDQTQLVDDVRSAGGKYEPFTKPGLCGKSKDGNCLEHGKVAIADQARALISSGNFNITNLCNKKFSPKTCNRDYSYVTENPAIVQSLYNVIENDLKGESYSIESVMVPEAKNLLTVGPNSQAPLIRFIESAKKSILLENQYLKDPVVNEALVTAANRGVSVQLVLASFCAFGKPSASEKKKVTAIFSVFEEAGIQVQIFDKDIKVNKVPGYMHAKSILIDGRRAWMGSVNGSTQATTINREFGVFFDDNENVSKLEKIMERDFNNPLGESWQESLDCAENH